MTSELKQQGTSIRGLADSLVESFVIKSEFILEE